MYKMLWIYESHVFVIEFGNKILLKGQQAVSYRPKKKIRKKLYSIESIEKIQ